MTTHPKCVDAAPRAFKPFHFIVLMLCLLGALIHAPDASAQNYNDYETGPAASLTGISRVSSLAIGEADEQPYVDTGNNGGGPQPSCHGEWTSSSFVNYTGGVVPAGWITLWNPASPSGPGDFRVVGKVTCINPPVTDVFALASNDESVCGGATMWVPQNNDCEQGFWLKGPQNLLHLGKPCKCSKGGVATADPIEMGAGNMFLNETDFTSGDPRFQFSRFYNSSAANAPNLTAVGLGWVGSTDAHIVNLQSLLYPQPQNPNASPVYSSPSAACTSGFAVLAAANPTLYAAGDSVVYVAPQITGQNGSCELLNAQGAFLAYLPILGTGTPAYAQVLVNVGVGVVRDDGSQYQFFCIGGTCYPQSNTSLQLSASASGYTLIDDDGVTETYNAAGILLTRTWKDGYSLTLVHNGDGVTGGDGTVQTISDNHGRTLTFSYDSDGK
ncbi:MAG TPA: DUF6531 domain-containing protein, partial [Xanthomonadaceae bacterium]|nr:DUF6531 domain-containing protein [Xanthomonadaceae bacterium]